MIGSVFARSSWLKFGRAEEHFDTLCNEVELWAKSDPCAISKQCNAEGSRYSFSVEIKKPPSLNQWSLIAGDCVHNLRSALDNLVYALAIRDSGNDPPPSADRLQFPIADDNGAFVKQGFRIAPLSDATQARIERAQPYNRPHQELPPLLSLLRDFNNLDKHRLLNVVIANVQQGHIRLEYPGEDAYIPFVEFGCNLGAIENGAEIAYALVSPPKLGMDYKYKASIVISIGHAAGPSGRTLGELVYILDILIEEVRDVIVGLI